MFEKSESWRSSVSAKSTVDLWRKYPRKYWSIKKCSITVKCRSTIGKLADHNNFRNEFRYFLYRQDPEFEAILCDMEDEDTEYLWQYMKKHEIHFLDPQGNISIKEYLEALGIDYSISIQIREYEKEVFQLKCLTLRKKPQIMLRGLLRLSLEKKRDEVFTSPELLSNLLLIREIQPIFRKDVKFM